MSEELPHYLDYLTWVRNGIESVPAELLWFTGVVCAAFMALLMLRVANWRLRRSFETIARLQSLSISLEDTGPVLVGFYDFKHRGLSYPGAGVLSLTTFVGPDAHACIGAHEWLDLPVLQIDGEVYVGEEAIEHVLFGLRSTIRIRFLSADPSRNSPVSEYLLPEHNDYLTS